MPTQEYLIKYIEASARYQELPTRLKLVISEDEWTKRVKEYCVHRGMSWETSPARTVCDERSYYETLLSEFRMLNRIFPYHLGEYICRVLRVSPFRYYKDILANSMKEDNPYDSIPNFTAADALKVVGVGRNEYIAIMQQAKSKRLMWRVNKGLVRDLLPERPRSVQPAAWWRVCVVNLGEVEFRTMSAAEAEVCRLAANYADGAPYKMLDPHAVFSLYTRELVWFNIPISPEDQVSIPPLEGFVSNKTSSVSSIDGIDPLETLLYQIFVAASERVRVVELADILNIPMDNLKVGISMACRLGFCNKLSSSPEASLSNSAHSTGDFSPRGDMLQEAMASPASVQGELELGSPYNELKTKIGKSVAFVVDSAVTGYLMMGALTPEVKKHSVTLFEGGRVYGASVINELIDGLQSSVEISKDFEGEMLNLAATAASMAAVLKCLQSQNRPIELLRKESMESLPLTKAERILSHSYDIIVPAAGLTGPSLPCSISSGPANFGPLPASLTPWMNIALYKHGGLGPKSLIIPAGHRLHHLPNFISDTNSAVMLWRWDGMKTGLKAEDPLIISSRCSLAIINSLLTSTAVLIQSVDSENIENDGNSPAIAHVPLPLSIQESSKENMVTSPAFSAHHGEMTEVHYHPKIQRAMEEMGISKSIGSVQFMRMKRNGNWTWVPLGVWLGIPLSPVPLCLHVCETLEKMEFLSHESCEQQRRGQTKLQQILHDLIDSHVQPGHLLPMQCVGLDETGVFVHADTFLHS